MLIYTIVVTYNGSKWIEKCIASLVNSTVATHVIVVDNGSNDETLDIIRDRFPQVEIIETGQNLGFGKANNIGIRKAYDAGANYVFLLNQDAWVELDTLGKLVDISKSFPQYGIISPVHLRGDGTAFEIGFLTYLCKNDVSEFFSKLYINSEGEFAAIYPLEFVNAAFWLLPRKTIELVGGFNPFFFHYGEDNDYVNRCKYFNLKVGFVPFANAYHDRPEIISESRQNVFQRIMVLTRLFDPRDSLTVDEHIVVIIRAIIKRLISFKWPHIKNLWTDLTYYYANRKEISKISRMLRSPGLTFLD